MKGYEIPTEPTIDIILSSFDRESFTNLEKMKSDKSSNPALSKVDTDMMRIERVAQDIDQEIKGMLEETVENPPLNTDKEEDVISRLNRLMAKIEVIRLQ